MSPMFAVTGGGGGAVKRQCVLVLLLLLLGVAMTAAHRLATDWVNAASNSGEPCRFPSVWHGTWYESDVGQVVVSSTNISRKGHCIQRVEDFYLLENQDIGCYTCLLLSLRHHNVLQYKESFCIGKEPIDIVCSTIHIETVQRTLIRESSDPVPCPFSDAYHVTYNNNSGGFCLQPTSYLTPCASDSHLHFHLQKCPHIAYTYRRDAELECLAMWQDGSEQFLVGRFHGPGFSRKDDRYRCLMYQVVGTVVQAAMSADSSCRGLRSPRDGPVLFELTKDVMGWPQTHCSFPDWISRTSWRDLDAKSIYSVSSSAGSTNDVIRLAHQQESTSQSATVVNSKTSYQCVLFIKRTPDVVEMYTGLILEDDSKPCSRAEVLEASDKKILLPDKMPLASCPLEGRYNIHTGSTNCDSYFRSGCNGTAVIDIISTCASRPGLQLECLTSWREVDKWMIIAQLLGGSGVASCFSFRVKSSQTLYFTAEPDCNAGVTGLLRDRTTYVMSLNAHECDYATRPAASAVVIAAAAVPSQSSLSLINGTASDVPYSVLNAATVGTGSASSGGRQLRQHKMTNVELRQRSYGSSSTAATASLGLPRGLRQWCSYAVCVVSTWSCAVSFVTRQLPVPFTFIIAAVHQPFRQLRT